MSASTQATERQRIIELEGMFEAVMEANQELIDALHEIVDIDRRVENSAVAAMHMRLAAMAALDKAGENA